MADKTINPTLKLVLELGPILVFFLAYLRLRDETFAIGGTEYSGFIVVTAAFIPLILFSTGLLWLLSGRLSRMQVVTAVLVVVFGGLSVALNDERFFKAKPTIIYALFAVILGIGLIRGQSYLKYVLSEVVPLEHEGWMILTRRVAIFFGVLMVANEVVWRSMSTDAWVNFKTFGLPIATFAFFAAQSRLFAEHSSDTESGEG